MKKVKAIAALVLLGLFVSSSVFANPAVYEVSVDISQVGEAVASPTIRVKPEAAAEVSVSGDDGYRLSVSVAPVDGGAVDVSIIVETPQTSLRSTVTTLLSSPMVVASGDIEVRVTVTDGDGQQ